MAVMTSPYPRGAELDARAQRVIPGGVNSATRYVGAPYSFARADGAYVWDADGNRYLDYHAAFGAVLLGHAHRRVSQAVAAATQRMGLMGLGVSESEIELAERVAQIIPSVEQSIACMSGSEATAQALRLARAATGRRYIVKVQGGFHGGHDAVARNVISPPERAYRLDPLSGGILPEVLDATLIAEYNDVDSLAELFAAHPEQIAAVIIEPIPHNVGSLLPRPGYLQALREMTQREGTVLIFDEVITGFRHALGGYQEICGVTPDLTAYGKAMGNGYPIAGMGGSAALMQQFSSAQGTALLAGTFNGHPIGVAAALATLDELAGTDHYERVRALGMRMRTGLRAIVAELGLAAQVVGEGGVFVVYFTDAEPHGYRDLLVNDDVAYATFHRRMAETGFLMLPLSLKRNHISGAHTEQDVDRTLEAARDVLRGMRQEGLARQA